MTKSTSIYVLVDPRDETYHYIGKTIQNPPRKRLRQHLLKPATEALAEWINEVQSVGLKPELRVLEVVPENADWRAAEVYWIRYGLAHDWSLKNRASGGDNYPLELLSHADTHDIIPRTIYANENTLKLLTSINAYMMKGKTAEDNTFRDVFHQALLLVDAENTATFDAMKRDFCEIVLSHGIIQIGRGWRVPVMKKHNLIGGEFFAVGKPFTINGIAIPGKWDKAGWRTTIKMYKKTSDLFDTLATEMLNGQRRGYNDVLGRALNLLAEVFNQVMVM